MVEPTRLPFRIADTVVGASSLMPILPFKLSNQERVVEVEGLLDTGAVVSVLPYAVGIDLGAVWDEHGRALRLTGNFARHEARVLIVTAMVSHFAPVNLAFAWTRAENAPLLLGQMNFFQEFEVCFYRARGLFEIQPRRDT